jgi:hypothetical protein
MDLQCKESYSSSCREGAVYFICGKEKRARGGLIEARKNGVKILGAKTVKTYAVDVNTSRSPERKPTAQVDQLIGLLTSS